MKMDLVDKALKGDRKAIARLISYVEDQMPNSEEALSHIYPYTGRCYVVGVTGSAGVGKSCLISRMTSDYRARGMTVGIISIDPNSPITGGAILGDRIRMHEHFLDEEVFIRSMGTRGCSGGLSKTTRDAVKILDASGKEVVIVETAGTGQSDVDIAKYADTTIVTLMPGMGDEIQAIKAGIFEVGDIFVVNKADMAGADETVMILEDVFESSPNVGWRPPVIKTVATTGEGIPLLLLKIDEHRKYLASSGQLRVKQEKRSEAEILEIVTKQLGDYVTRQVELNEEYRELVLKTTKREIDPRSAAKKLVKSIFNIQSV